MSALSHGRSPSPVGAALRRERLLPQGPAKPVSYRDPMREISLDRLRTLVVIAERASFADAARQFFRLADAA